jgi:hypothetical protein
MNPQQMKIEPETKCELDKLKTYPGQSYSKVIKSLIVFYKLKTAKDNGL